MKSRVCGLNQADLVMACTFSISIVCYWDIFYVNVCPEEQPSIQYSSRSQNSLSLINGFFFNCSVCANLMQFPKFCVIYTFLVPSVCVYFSCPGKFGSVAIGSCPDLTVSCIHCRADSISVYLILILFL